MTLDQLEIFQLVADLGSLSKAAKASDIAQSLVSRKLAQLEEEWGDRLFHRTGRGVVLTEFGERIQPHARLLLQQAEQLRAEVKDAAGVPTGKVHIGILPSLSRHLVMELFSRIKKSAPGVRLHVTEGFSGDLDAQLASGKVDIAVINRYGGRTPSGEEVLGRIDTYLVGPPHMLASFGSTVQFRDLHDIPLALPTTPNGLRSMMDQIARQKAVSLNVVIEVDTLPAMKDVAIAGNALTLLPFPAVDREVAARTLGAARIVNPAITRTISLGVTHARPLSRAGRLVLAHIRDIVPAMLVQHAQP